MHWQWLSEGKQTEAGQLKRGRPECRATFLLCVQIYSRTSSENHIIEVVLSTGYLVVRVQSKSVIDLANVYTKDH